MEGKVRSVHSKATDTQRHNSNGYTVLEVVIAIFIFGCVAASLFRLIMSTDRIRGRSLHLEYSTRLATDEAERLRSHAAENTPIEDSTYTAGYNGRRYLVKRHVIEKDEPPSFLPQAREPVAVEITVTDERNIGLPELTFKLLVGQEQP